MKRRQTRGREIPSPRRRRRIGERRWRREERKMGVETERKRRKRERRERR